MKEIGELLRTAREEKKMSIELLHQRTRIRPGLIEAIEDGRFDAVPSGSVYLKGFLRTLCNELDVDYGQVSALLDPSPSPTKQDPVQPIRLHPRRQRRPLMIIIIAVLIVGALMGVGFYVRFVLPQPEVPPLEGSGLPLEDQVAEAPGETSGDTSEEDDTLENPADNEPFDPEPEMTVVLLSEVVTSDSTNLSFEVSHWPMSLMINIKNENCWVRVEADGEVVEGIVWPPGTSKEFAAEQTMGLRLGLARAAEIIVNGIDLGVQTGFVKVYTFLKPSP